MKTRAAEKLSVALSLLLVASLSISAGHAVSSTSASAITQPPNSMVGINTHHDLFSGGMDPDFVTLGPKEGSHPEYGSYPTKVGVNYELPVNSPILAPLDSQFIGFNNRNSDSRNGMDGTLQVPFDDLQLCFKSVSKDWPGLIYCFYHLKNSPLLLGINRDKLCSNAPLWPGPMRAGGKQFYPENEMTAPVTKLSISCRALLGKKIARGGVVGYAGKVGTHSQAPIMVKVYDSTFNPTVKMGNPNLHWVQSDLFFYWKCFSPKATFEPGVLAYPFECGGYKVAKSEKSIGFKYKK